MPATKFNLTIEQGRTFSQVVRWEAEPHLFAQIQSVTNSAPAKITTQAPHGLTNGWRVAVVGVGGLTSLNASGNPPKEKDYRRVKVNTPTEIEFNALSTALDKSYSGGGYLQFYSPVDLLGFTARMSVKDKIGGVELLSFTTENGRVLLDNTAKTITLTLPAADAAALSWKTGVYDLEMVAPDGDVTAILTGAVSVTLEVTTQA